MSSNRERLSTRPSSARASLLVLKRHACQRNRERRIYMLGPFFFGHVRELVERKLDAPRWCSVRIRQQACIPSHQIDHEDSVSDTILGTFGIADALVQTPTKGQQGGKPGRSPPCVFSEIVEGICHRCMRIGPGVYAAIEFPLNQSA